jgi:hypothetical protein
VDLFLHKLGITTWPGNEGLATKNQSLENSKFVAWYRMAEVWSREEVEAAVADYFAMLKKELTGESYSKARHWKQLRPMLSHRTSVDRKHQNISAVLIELGYPYISGYKPLWNYQELIRNVVISQVEADPVLTEIVSRAVVKPVEAQPNAINVKLVPPPKKESKAKPPRLSPVRKDYLEIEARNRALGTAGEKFVIEIERKRLHDGGRTDLAKKVEHVAETRGDLLGYDVLSFETDGCERCVEVKTTRYGEMTPFYVSPNEVEVSEEHATSYQLFRLFEFETTTGLFILPGSLRKSCRLEPVRFAAFRLM